MTTEKEPDPNEVIARLRRGIETMRLRLGGDISEYPDAIVPVRIGDVEALLLHVEYLERHAEYLGGWLERLQRKCVAAGLGRMSIDDPVPSVPFTAWKLPLVDDKPPVCCVPGCDADYAMHKRSFTVEAEGWTTTLEAEAWFCCGHVDMLDGSGEAHLDLRVIGEERAKRS